MTTALLLIDIQNDYFPGGAMEVEGSAAASLRAKAALARFRELGLPVFHVQHLATRPGSTFFLPDTAGAEIHEHARPLPDEALVQKHFPNAFRDTELRHLLRERGAERLVASGMMTHMCVDATVRAAFDQGFPCTVLHDACATRALAFGGVDVPAAHVHAAFLSALGAVYAQVVGTEELLGTLE
jgi:nicotinamidase-related amidase